METRIIKTNLYRNTKFRNLTNEDKFIVIFLLTNEFLDCLPAVEVGLDVLAFNCCVTQQKLESKINTFTDFGIFYIDGYLLISDKYTYANYKGGKTEKKKNLLFDQLPDNIKLCFTESGEIGQSLPNHCPTVGHINHKSEIINQKPEMINNNSKRVRAKNRSTIQDSDFCKLLEDDERMNNLLSRIKEKYPRYTLEWLRDKVEQLREWHAGAPPSKRKKDLERFILVTAGRDYKQFLDTLAAEKRLQNAEGGYKSSVQRNMEDNARIDAWRIVRALKIDLEEGNISLQEYQDEMQKLENQKR